MSIRPIITVDPTTIVRPTARVARVAVLLDCDESDVRRLIDRGEIEAHGIGKRGVRVFLDSVAAYQDRNHRQPKKPVGKPHKPRTANRAAQRAAEEELRAAGIIG